MQAGEEAASFYSESIGSSGSTSGNPQFAISPYQPSVSHVPEKVVSQIKEGKLVDLRKLLRKDATDFEVEEGAPLTYKDGKFQLARI